MGCGIATAFAMYGYHVSLLDQTKELAQRASDRIREIVTNLPDDYGEPKRMPAQIMAALSYEGENNLDTLVPAFSFIIESVFEDPEVKKNLYARINPLLSKDCIVCSNTSALNIFEAADLTYPENLMITHWFNPAYVMELIELIRGPKTSDAAVEAAISVLMDIGKKLAVINQYIPGFIVNRLGAALMREATYMIQQGWTSAADIDSAMSLTCGMRYAFEGPVALYDVVGWNIIQAGAKAIYPSLCNDAENGNRLAQELIEQGNLGIVSGKGVYDYSGVDIPRFMNNRTEKILKMQQFTRTGL